MLTAYFALVVHAFSLHFKGTERVVGRLALFQMIDAANVIAIHHAQDEHGCRLLVFCFGDPLYGIGHRGGIWDEVDLFDLCGGVRRIGGSGASGEKHWQQGGKKYRGSECKHDNS